ncbi:hypothetical protein KCU65_g6240, partial [Aureobasidium melanogenum]
MSSQSSNPDQPEPPEEYHHILNQFRARNWSPIHEPQPEPNDPVIDSSNSDLLENAMLEAESRRKFPGTLDLVSPFREPNIFDYLDLPPEIGPPTPHIRNYHIVRGYLNFDSRVGIGNVARYLAFEPTIQNRDFELETQDINNEIQELVARHQVLVEGHQSITSREHQHTGVIQRHRLIQVLEQLHEVVMDVSDAFEIYMRKHGIQLCKQLLRYEISRVEAYRQYNLYSAYSSALDEYEMRLYGYQQDVERLDLFTQQEPEAHERLTTLYNIDTHMADQTVVTPIAYILTEEDFLEEVEEDPPDADEQDFQERLRELRMEESEASSRY